MDKYIDRGAAIKAIEFNKGVGCSDRCVQGIKYIPAADVVEVVRCKDCIHRPFSTEPGETSGFAVEAPDYICPCHNPGDGYYSWVPNDDFFCANGERK